MPSQSAIDHGGDKAHWVKSSFGYFPQAQIVLFLSLLLIFPNILRYHRPPVRYLSPPPVLLYNVLTLYISVEALRRPSLAEFGPSHALNSFECSMPTLSRPVCTIYKFQVLNASHTPLT